MMSGGLHLPQQVRSVGWTLARDADTRFTSSGAPRPAGPQADSTTPDTIAL